MFLFGGDEMTNDEFDINNIKNSDMQLLAEQIENYIMFLEEVMIIPPELMEKHEDSIKNAIKVSKKLIKKLKKGDKSVFKDEDEWNLI